MRSDAWHYLCISWAFENSASVCLVTEQEKLKPWDINSCFKHHHSVISTSNDHNTLIKQRAHHGNFAVLTLGPGPCGLRTGLATQCGGHDLRGKVEEVPQVLDTFVGEVPVKMTPGKLLLDVPTGLQGLKEKQLQCERCRTICTKSRVTIQISQLRALLDYVKMFLMETKACDFTCIAFITWRLGTFLSESSGCLARWTSFLATMTPSLKRSS